MSLLTSVRSNLAIIAVGGAALAAVAYPYRAAFRLDVVEGDVRTLKANVVTIGERLSSIEKAQDAAALNANQDRQTWAEIRAALKTMTDSWNAHLVQDASRDFRLGELEKVRTVVNELSASMVKERAANEEFKIAVERTLQHKDKP